MNPTAEDHFQSFRGTTTLVSTVGADPCALNLALFGPLSSIYYSRFKRLSRNPPPKKINICIYMCVCVCITDCVLYQKCPQIQLS